MKILGYFLFILYLYIQYILYIVYTIYIKFYIIFYLDIINQNNEYIQMLYGLI